jgi:hypothetical protein
MTLRCARRRQMMCTVTTNQMCTAIRTITLLKITPFKEPKRKKDKSLTIIAVASQEEKQGQTSQLEPITSDFESWWRLYPRRVGKLKAEQAYTSVIETTSRIRLAFVAACPEADLIRCLPGALLPLGP